MKKSLLTIQIAYPVLCLFAISLLLSMPDLFENRIWVLAILAVPEVLFATHLFLHQKKGKPQQFLPVSYVLPAFLNGFVCIACWQTVSYYIEYLEEVSVDFDTSNIERTLIIYSILLTIALIFAVTNILLTIDAFSGFRYRRFTLVCGIINLIVNLILFSLMLFNLKDVEDSSIKTNSTTVVLLLLALSILKFLFQILNCKPKLTVTELEREINHNRFLVNNRMISYEKYVAAERYLMQQLAEARKEQEAASVDQPRLDNFQIQVLYRLRSQNLMTDEEYNYFISRR